MRPEVVRQIAPLELRARAIVEGFIAGRHRSPYRGYSVEFAEHREYAPGDDIRHIDWRVYARADRFYVKQYEEETNLETHLLLDTSASMAYPAEASPGRMSKFEYAACAAASLAWLLLEQQDAAGLVLFDSDIREEFAPTMQRARLRSLFDVMDRARPSGDSDLAMPLRKLADRLRRRGLVVLLSDLLAPVQAVIDGLLRFRHDGHEVVVLQILDRDEVEFPFLVPVQFEALEGTGAAVRSDPPALRRSYRAAMRAAVGRIRAACADHGIDYALIATHDPLDVALSTFLARRMHRPRL